MASLTKPQPVPKGRIESLKNYVTSEISSLLVLIVAVEITIPGPLLQYTKNQKEVQLNAHTLLDAIRELDRMFPGMKDRICDEQERVRAYVNIFINGEDFRHLRGEQTTLGDDDEIMILPSIAGGAL